MSGESSKKKFDAFPGTLWTSGARYVGNISQALDMARRIPGRSCFSHPKSHFQAEACCVLDGASTDGGRRHKKSPGGKQNTRRRGEKGVGWIVDDGEPGSSSVAQRACSRRPGRGWLLPGASSRSPSGGTASARNSFRIGLYLRGAVHNLGTGRVAISSQKRAFVPSRGRTISPSKIRGRVGSV